MPQRGAPRQSPMQMGTGDGDGHEQHGGGDHDPRQMTAMYHRSTLWIPITVIICGAWLISSPFTFGYTELADAGPRMAEITELRGLPAPQVRAGWMVASDLLSGLLLLLFGGLSLKPGRVWSRWAACLVGAWLLFAPLLLWTPSAAAFATDTIVGVLVIALTILIPKMPGMMLIMQPGPERPPGWSYNPSSWYQRAPMIVLAFIGFFFSRYLGAYQLGFLDWAVDPFFSGGTVAVLDSSVSMAFPVSDATLGAAAITLEGLMGFMGSTSRWRTMPWMVSFFGFLVIPLGIAHVVLVILQPVAVGAWCTLCLATAGLMLLMIPLAVDEVVAMSQLVITRVRAGDGFWHVFFKGGTLEGGGEDDRSPAYPDRPVRMAAAGLWGVSVPWTLAASALLGIWLMASPGILGTAKPAADSAHLTGALVLVVAVLATAEVVRAARFANVATGAWLVASHWVLSGADLPAQLLTTVVGAALVALSLPRGPIRESYGSADRWVR